MFYRILLAMFLVFAVSSSASATCVKSGPTTGGCAGANQIYVLDNQSLYNDSGTVIHTAGVNTFFANLTDDTWTLIKAKCGLTVTVEVTSYSFSVRRYAEDMTAGDVLFSRGAAALTTGSKIETDTVCDDTDCDIAPGEVVLFSSQVFGGNASTHQCSISYTRS